MTEQMTAALEQVTEAHTAVVRAAMESGSVDYLRHELQNLAWVQQGLVKRLEQLDSEKGEAA